MDLLNFESKIENMELNITTLHDDIEMSRSPEMANESLVKDIEQSLEVGLKIHNLIEAKNKFHQGLIARMKIKVTN